MQVIAEFIREVLFFPLTLLNFIILKSSKVRYKRIVIKGVLFISNAGRVEFGDRVRINSSRFKNIIGGDHRTSIIVKKDAFLKLGENVRISNSAIYCAKNIVIGDNTMIGGSTKIWDTDFHPLNSTERLNNPNAGFVAKPVIIGNNAFIGAFSIILKGTQIGDNSIIGAGSVVSGTVPENQIWAGNPARFIKNIL